MIRLGVNIYLNGVLETVDRDVARRAVHAHQRHYRRGAGAWGGRAAVRGRTLGVQYMKRRGRSPTKAEPVKGINSKILSYSPFYKPYANIMAVIRPDNENGLTIPYSHTIPCVLCYRTLCRRRA